MIAILQLRIEPDIHGCGVCYFNIHIALEIVLLYIDSGIETDGRRILHDSIFLGHGNVEKVVDPVPTSTQTDVGIL